MFSSKRSCRTCKIRESKPQNISRETGYPTVGETWSLDRSLCIATNLNDIWTCFDKCYIVSTTWYTFFLVHFMEYRWLYTAGGYKLDVCCQPIIRIMQSDSEFSMFHGHSKNTGNFGDRSLRGNYLYHGYWAAKSDSVRIPEEFWWWLHGEIWSCIFQRSLWIYAVSGGAEQSYHGRVFHSAHLSENFTTGYHTCWALEKVSPVTSCYFRQL